jgi:Cdc6-like AAA superfamily ATPase
MPYITDRLHETNRERHHSEPARPTFDPVRTPHDSTVTFSGQTAAVDSVVRALTLSHAGLTDPSRPIANLLFVGPTGVGKTELVRRVAAEVRSVPTTCAE